MRMADPLLCPDLYEEYVFKTPSSQFCMLLPLNMFPVKRPPAPLPY